jgi:hypothetical protein
LGITNINWKNKEKQRERKRKRKRTRDKYLHRLVDRGDL